MRASKAQGGEEMLAQTPAQPSLWKTVAAALRQEVTQLAVGDQLPTEIGLASRFGVSRFTVRRALAELEKDGAIRIEHGRGLFVAEHAVPLPLVGRVRFTDTLRRLNMPGQRQILSIDLHVAEPHVCQPLALPPGSDVYCLETILSLEGRPLGTTTNYFPAERFPGFDRVMREQNSVTRSFRAFGLEDYRRGSSSIIGRMPTEREAARLKIARSRPVLELHKIDVDLQGRPITFGIGCYAADRVQFFTDDPAD